MLKIMHLDVVAIWAKTKGLGHLCTSDTCLLCIGFLLSVCKFCSKMYVVCSHLTCLDEESLISDRIIDCSPKIST